MGTKYSPDDILDILGKVCSADKVFTVYTFVVLLIKFCATINESGVFLNLNRFS